MAVYWNVGTGSEMSAAALKLHPTRSLTNRNDIRANREHRKKPLPIAFRWSKTPPSSFDAEVLTGGSGMLASSKRIRGSFRMGAILYSDTVGRDMLAAQSNDCNVAR